MLDTISVVGHAFEVGSLSNECLLGKEVKRPCLGLSI